MNADDRSAPVAGAGKPGPSKPPKAQYVKPVLRVYGSVSGLTMGGGGTKADGKVADKITSDRAAKTNIVRVGNHPAGVGLYIFEYKPEFRRECGDGPFVGVMADEVETVLPEAVSLRADGYKQVDYRLLALASHGISVH
jgi:hypothetical protein